MSQITEVLVRETLSAVKYPGFSRDILSFGLLKNVEIEGAKIAIRLALTTNEAAIPQTIKEDCERVLRAIPGVEAVRVVIDIHAPPHAHGGAVGPQQIDGIRKIIAVASGKGGVGKSTVAANLAVAFQQSGLRVGLCDCDMYGPSIAMMFGSRERPFANEQDQIIPIEQCGLKLMSMGFLLDDHSPAILRGPMVTRYTQQFLRQVEWGALDVLVLDLPPGTGDIQLTIVQTIALEGAVIVTTPQEVALIDARKAAAMFEKVNVPVLGLVENMSYFVSPGDGSRHEIFGEGGGKRESARLRVPLLAQLPLDIATRESGDKGLPITAANRENPVSVAFQNVAQQLRKKLALD